jgi:hypothetical protein
MYFHLIADSNYRRQTLLAEVDRSRTVRQARRSRPMKATSLRLALLTVAFICAFALVGNIQTKGGPRGLFDLSPHHAAAAGNIQYKGGGPR